MKSKTSTQKLEPLPGASRGGTEEGLDKRPPGDQKELTLAPGEPKGKRA